MPTRALRSACDGDVPFHSSGLMITAEPLIAKIVIAVVAKLAAAMSGLVPTKRKRACRYLVKLYYAVQALDEVTSRVIRQTDGISSEGSSGRLIRSLVQEQQAIEFASNAFIDLSRDLDRGLALLNPALHQLCRVIYRGKADFLSCMSYGLNADLRSTNARVLRPTLPTERLIATDFTQAYEDSRRIVEAGSEYYWPSGAFDYFTDSEQLEIFLGSDAEAGKVISFIRRHHASLSAAKESLRQFLANSFTIEELLFHQDETPE
jgi:hypothetical protein